MLLQVHSITGTAIPGMLRFDITVETLGRILFHYHVSDTAPLTLELTEWISNNPDYPVIPYVE